MVRNDLTGKKYGKLTVIEFAHKGKHSKWLCLCDCGVYKEIRTDHLISGATESCGCNHRNSPLVIKRTHGLLAGKKNMPLYRVWRSMRDRCKKDHYYKDILVCKEWQDFVPFYNWAILNGYKKGLTLDRKNPLGNYEPDNCRWITIQEQERNKTNHVPITIKGETKHSWEWEAISGVPMRAITRRINMGWSHERAVFTPIKK